MSLFAVVSTSGCFDQHYRHFITCPGIPLGFRVAYHRARVEFSHAWLRHVYNRPEAKN